MSTPTAQFSALSLPDESPEEHLVEDMRGFQDIPFEERKYVARDIVLSFDTDRLPLEFDIDVREHVRITEEDGRQPSAQWTIPGNFIATQIIRACLDRDNWIALNKFQTAGNRALMFEQKLRRRLREQFEIYDMLAESHHSGTIEAGVNNAGAEILKVVNALRVDLAFRHGRQYNATMIMLGLLRNVCERDEALPRNLPTLYARLIGEVISEPMLETLELLHKQRPRSFTNEAQGIMQVIQQALAGNGADEDYITKFRALQR